MPKTKSQAPKPKVAFANEALGGNDVIVLKLQWNPQQVGAWLDHLLYNRDLIHDVEPDSQLGLVTFAFHRASALVHLFQWSLLFPGKKLQDLKAVALVNGVADDLGSAPTAESRWPAHGTWEGGQK